MVCRGTTCLTIVYSCDLDVCRTASLILSSPADDQPLFLPPFPFLNVIREVLLPSLMASWHLLYRMQGKGLEASHRSHTCSPPLYQSVATEAKYSWINLVATKEASNTVVSMALLMQGPPKPSTAQQCSKEALCLLSPKAFSFLWKMTPVTNTNSCVWQQFQ